MSKENLIKNKEIINRRQKGNYKRLNQRSKVDKKKNEKLYKELSNSKRNYHSPIEIKENKKGKEFMTRQCPVSKGTLKDKKIKNKIERRRLNKLNKNTLFDEVNEDMENLNV